MSSSRYYSPAPHDRERHYDPTFRLERKRHANDQKLKGTFERLFEKYATDFSQVGDEVDIRTGEIIVDNGHIALMEHERDVGNSASKQFVRAIEEELGVEEEDDEEGEDDGDGDDDDVDIDDDVSPGDSDIVADLGNKGDEASDTDEDELSLAPSGSHREQLSSVSRTRTPVTENGDETGGNAVCSSALAHPRVPGSLTGPEQADLDDTDQDEHSEGDHAVQTRGQLGDTSILQSTEVVSNIPNINIQDSLNALVPHQDQSGRIDPDAVQALGQSIANQIANFLTRYTTGASNHHSNDPWSAPPLPHDAFAPPRYLDDRRFNTPRAQRYESIAQSPAGGPSLWAPEPTVHRRGSYKRRKKNSQVNGRLLLEDHDHPNQYEPGDYSFESADDTERPYIFGEQHHTDGDLTDTGSSRRGRRWRFGQDEDELIKRLKEIDGLSWQDIAQRIPGRSTSSILQRYSRALKKLPRPVLVKREIIEIMDENDLVDQESPHYRVIQHDALPMTSPRRQPPTPLLRQALGNRIDPTLIQDDDGNDDHDETDGTPAPYPMRPPKQLPKTKVAKGPRAPHRWHGKPESQRRYQRFDTTNAAGSFGLLRTDSPVPVISYPQQHIIGPRSATTGAFGVLRVMKEQPKQTRKASTTGGGRHAASGNSRSRRKPTDEGGVADEGAPAGGRVPAEASLSGMFQVDGANDHTSPQGETVSTSALQAIDPRLETSHENADDSDVPATTPYADVTQTANGGPYFVPQIPKAPTEDQHGLFTAPYQPVNNISRFPSSSPPLPTPSSDGSGRFGHVRGATHLLPPHEIGPAQTEISPRNVAPPAPMYTQGHRSDALLAPSAESSATKATVTARTYDEFFAQLKNGLPTPTTMQKVIPPKVVPPKVVPQKVVPQKRVMETEDNGRHAPLQTPKRMPKQKQQQVWQKQDVHIADDEGSEDELAL
ncbi:hypothetical protein MBLNU459_g2199t1 [Dothideomycetes sp. NU459]